MEYKENQLRIKNIQLRMDEIRDQIESLISQIENLVYEYRMLQEGTKQHHIIKIFATREESHQYYDKHFNETDKKKKRLEKTLDKLPPGPVSLNFHCLVCLEDFDISEQESHDKFHQEQDGNPSNQ